MKRLLYIFSLLVLLTGCIHAQQQGLGGTMGVGGIAGYQSNNSRLVITTNNLPDAPAGVAYSQTLTAVNGVSPLTWTIIFGSLPPGLSINSSTGAITGTPTPTTIGNYPFTVLLTDSTSPTAKTATQDLSIAVTCAPLQITTQSPLPPATVGSADNQQFLSTGGLGTISWTNPGGGIPTGTTFSGTGLLSGTPTSAGQFNFNITATDTCPVPQVVTAPYSQQVNNLLTITTTSPLPNGTRGSPYSVQMAASGGTTPYAWLQLSGTLPAGLTLSSTGRISGTPLNAESDTVKIQVTDNVGNKNNSDFQITISCTPLVITSGPTLPVGTQGQPYSSQLLSSGGSGTVTWSILSGTLDPGLNLSLGGLISGTPTSPGNYNPTIQAQDSCTPTPQTVPQAFTLTIVQGLTITTNSLPAGVQGVPYAANVVVQGGTPPYTWSVPSGPIPTGAVDMLDWIMMRLSDSASFHMAGTVTPGGSSSSTYSLRQGGLASNIKSGNGNPWDIRYYDDQFIYFWYTENNDAVDQAACQAAGYASCFVDPFAYKQALNPRPSMPRYYVLGSPDVTIKLPAPNPRIRTTNCGADNQPQGDLGNIVFVLHDAGSGVDYGGDVGSIHTLTLLFYHGINSTTAPYTGGTLETYYFAYPFGRFEHTNADWNGVTYVVNQTTLNNNRVTGGAPTMNFGCTIPNLSQAGILPTGVPVTTGPSLNLVASTGAITGTPNSAGTSQFNIQVEDSTGAITQKPLSITTTCPTLSLTSTSPLTQGTVGQPYSFQLLASGGATPRTWHLVGGTLPTGLALSTTGLLSGTPTQTGVFNPNIQVLDSCAPQKQSAQKNFTLTIAANSGPITITTTSPLPQGTEQQSYSQQLQVTGGTPGYVWSVQSGTLPAGLTQNSAGLVAGTPTATGVSTWTARVTDSIAGFTTKSLSLTIACPALAITSTSPIPPATVGQPYSFQFASSGGIPAIVWSATGVPAGLTLSGTGLLSGTPTVAATSTINVTATDHCLPTPQTSGPTGFSLTVNAVTAPVLVTSTSPLPSGVEGQAYSNQLSATGGIPPYTWSITAGALQTGLNLSTAGLISGTPTTASTVTPTFKVLDTVGGTDSKNISLTTACPAFTVTSASPLPTATQNQAYSFQFTRTGGIAPVAWTATGVPTGLTLNSATGLLSGTPTGTGTSNINVTATDSCSPTPQVVGPTAYSLTINAAPNPLSINTSTPLPSAVQNQTYSTTITATGGTPPYGSWTVTVGTLPTGLTLHSTTGVIDGTPTVVGTASFTVRVTDAVPNNASKAFTLTVAAASTADNRYCNVNETSNFANPTDGPATLFQRCVRTAIADTPAAGPTKTVCASGCDFTTIQAAVNAASAGWIIQVKATTGGTQNILSGAAISGLHGTATNWIWIETDQTASLPAEGTRMTPAWVGKPTLPGRPSYNQPSSPGTYLPKIRGGNNTFTLTNSSFIRLIGLEFTTTSGSNVSAVTAGTTSDHIIYDRDLCHGGDSPNWQDRDSVTRCFSWSGMTYSAVIDSYVADTHCVVGGSCTDSQAILAGGNAATAEGPFKFVNDFLETAAEPILFGGGGANASTTIPCDLEIRRNHFFKPLFWKVNDPSYFGTDMEVKNNSEMKTGCRALWEGSILDTTWQGQADQKAFQFLLGPKNQSSAFGGTASSNGAGSITKLTGAFAFNSAQVSPLCAIPLHCNFKYNGIVYPTNTVIDGTHITVGPNRTTGLLPPVTSSASFLAFQPGQNPNATVNNITVRYNRYMHSGNGYEIFVTPSDGGDVGKGEYNISVHDEVWDDVDGAKWCSYPSIANCGFAWSLALGQISNDSPAPNNLHDVTIRHVTGVVRDSFTSFPPGSIGPGIAFIHQSAPATSISNLKIYDNILPGGLILDQPGICSGGRIQPADVSFNCVTSVGGVGPTSGCFDHNALATTTATTGTVATTSNNPPYPAASPNCAFTVSGNFLPASYNAIQFTNLNGGIGGNYQLLNTSPFHNLASDGTDLGANVNLVNQYTSGVN